MSARSASAERRPSNLACSFSSTTAWVIAGLAPASSSAVSRSASEMKGIPFASWTVACEVTSGGTSGFWAMPDRNEAVSEVIRIAPASAVPIEAPNWVAVFWRPPTSGLCSSGTPRR